jgi:hypothetical protein
MMKNYRKIAILAFSAGIGVERRPKEKNVPMFPLAIEYVPSMGLIPKINEKH